MKFKITYKNKEIFRRAESAYAAATSLCDQYNWPYKLNLVDADTRGEDWAHLYVNPGTTECFTVMAERVPEPPKKTRTIILRNNFHWIQTTVRAKRDELGWWISPRAARRAWKTLCGMDDCCCSGLLGTRGGGNPEAREYNNRIYLDLRWYQ